VYDDVGLCGCVSAGFYVANFKGIDAEVGDRVGVTASVGVFAPG